MLNFFEIEKNINFQFEENRILEERSRIAVLYMATPLILVFSIVDYFYVPDKVFEFFFVRLTVVPFSIFYYFLAKIYPGKIWKMHFFTLYLGLYTTYLISRTGGEQSFYYAGLNLAIIGSLCFLPWNTKNIILSVITILMPYYVSVLVLSKNDVDYSIFLTNNSFIFSTSFLSMIVWYLSKVIRFKEFNLRKQLNEHISEQEKIINIKTKESVYLHRLSRQFSEEVVELLKQGVVNLDARERKFITCIFIDIEKSSEKSNRLDYKEYLEVCDDFFNICTDCLRERNITVGTYLGDGLIAFANAPTNVENHQRLALEACVEILKKRSRLSQHFRDKWKSDFNIRIGLNAGYAVAGFFPSGTRGNYSVNGPAVNLASRLCSIAEKNSIVISKDFLQFIKNDIKDLTVEKINKKIELKGFELDELVLFSVGYSSKVLFNVENCPLCNSNLILDEISKDLFGLKCVSCKYSDIVEKSDLTQKTG